ncbi:MAG: tape measure protein [Candidatus Bathyarchaeota archaeon]|nr:tape measure protein [Candidatus Bathyarchaeota archaeon]
MIFPIGFDLQKAVEEAGQEWDKKYAAKLESILAKRAVKVKLDFENLTDVKTRLAQLKIEPITPETKSAIKELARELTVLAKALEQVQKYSSRSVGTAEVRGARVDEIEAKAAAARELARQRAAKAEQAELKLAAAREKSATAANKATTAVNNLTKAYDSQTFYIERLLKKMVAVWSVQQVQNFLTNIREVTAQFELQRVSLGAIIQDTNKANQLFSEIKTFALKSPVSIMDLTKYTKQVAAYGVETKKLFDTTKMLTDISVGLGTDMSRATLFFGQVFATGYLRASELRQATEMGIPLVDKLAKKLEELNGRGYTAAEVMDLISKRAISFEMVEEVFKDMTSAGGQFYNIQEKQGNTLFGLWAKLGDAASVMYDEIGNTESVNQGMKTAIGLLTELMRNWKAVANTAQYFILPNAAILALYKYSTASQRVEAAQSAAAAATERRKAAVLQLAKLNEKATVDEINAAWATLQKAKADEVAAQKATTRMGLLKSGFVSVAKSIGAGLGIGLAITAVTTLVYKLFEAYENAHRLDRKLNEIDAERITLASQSVRNFEYLADAAIKAADGSKEQKDKLDELHRTFKDMIPVEDMSIENLRKLRSGADSAAEGYKSLTESIRNYIAQQQKQKALGAIEEEFGAKRITAMKNLYDWFDKQGLGVEERTRFFAEFEKQAQDTSKSLKEQIVAAFNEAGIEGGEKLANSIAEEKGFWNKALEWFGKNLPLMFGTTAITYKALFPEDGYINDLANATRKYNEEVSGTLSYYEGLEGALGKYTKAMEDAKKHMADFIPQGFKSDTFAYQQEVNAEQIRTWGGVIVDALKAENIKIENEWFNIDNDKAFNIADIATINIQAIKNALGSGHSDIKKLLDNIAKGYNEIVPKDAVVRSVRSKFEELANSMGLIDKVRGNMMGATEGLEAYRKKINDTAKDYAKQVENLTKVLAATPVISLAYKEIADKLENAKDLEEFYSKMAEILGKSTSGGGTRQSDPRLQILNDIANKMAQINKEYDDLLRKEGQTKALADTQKLFASSFADMQKMADKYKFKLPAFEVPQTIEDVQKWYDAIIKEINRLGIKNADKILIELGFKRDKSAIDKQQREIEAELKRLADRISRTKTAKEFYEKILSQTGDVELANRVSLSIYGSTGEELFEDTVAQIREVFKSGKEDVVIDLEPVFDMTNQRIDYKMLADIYEKYQNDIIEKNRDTAQKIAQEGQKEVATNISNWQKELAKAQSYEEQRTEIIRRESEKRAKIIKETRDPQERNRLVSLSYDKQAQELAKLAVDEFKSSDDYIKVFQDLDRVSTQTLDRMKKRLQEMIATVKDTENVEGLKSLVEQLDKINEERETRNPIEGIIDSFKEYAKARKDYRTAEAEEARVKAEFAQQEVGLNMAIQTAKAEQAIAQQRVTDLEAQGKLNTDEGVAAQLALNDATTKVTQATEKRNKAVEQVNKAEQNTTDAIDAQKAAIAKLSKNVNAMANAFSSAASSIQTIADMMGVAEDSELGDIVNGLVSGLNNAATIMTTILAIAIAIEAACWWLLAIGGAIAAFSAIGSWLTGSKVRKANKEIERQERILEELEYAYGRLEKAMERVFGSEMVGNIKAQQKNLQAQAEAYRKQAEAERSKGKKTDEDKLRDYENSYRETMDRLAELQGKVAEQLIGSDLSSTARDFAKAWVEAYREFGNTADAMGKKFREMVENMVTEGLMARAMERALKPTFDMIDRMEEGDFYDRGFWERVMETADKGARDANAAGAAIMAWAEQWGYQSRGDAEEARGIAKSVGSATSEEVNANTAALTTQTHYMAMVNENVWAIRRLMEAGTTGAGVTGTIDYTPMMETANAHLSSLPRIEHHIAEIHTLLGRVVTTRGGSWAVNSRYTT